jgi:DNA repair exonuclease SbcCD nuclease subunit
MKTAFTADVHLNPTHSERLEGFSRILELLDKTGIKTLVVAGDLFDSDRKGYKQFEQVAGKYPGISLVLIPGNHDPGLSNSMFSLATISVIEKPTLMEIGSQPFLLVPFTHGSTFHRSVSSSLDPSHIRDKQPVIVSHGDFGRTSRSENGNESGYFPITREDLSIYNPASVILGHIHTPGKVDNLVQYTGSPWPLDISEQGQRSIVTVDHDTSSFERIPLTHAPCNLVIDLPVVPGANIKELLSGVISRELKKLDTHPGREIDPVAVRVRIKLRGYTNSIPGLLKLVEQVVTELDLELESINSDECLFADNSTLDALAGFAVDNVDRAGFHYPEIPLIESDIKQKIMEMIYER